MANVSRNDPCPCGSGKKYKNCCAIKPASRGFKAEVITGLQENVLQPGLLSALFRRNVTDQPPLIPHPKEEEKLDM